jgi:hypothetical protein
VTGSCLCGQVAFEITGALLGVSCCHCSLCRKASGVAATATIVVAADQLRWISGRELVQQFERPSGYGVAFCRKCGAPVPDPDAAGERYGVPAGALDDDAGVAIAKHIHVGSKAAWDIVGGDAPQFP